MSESTAITIALGVSMLCLCVSITVMIVFYFVYVKPSQPITDTDAVPANDPLPIADDQGISSPAPINININNCSSDDINDGNCKNNLVSQHCNLKMQEDGNLVVYTGNDPVWASNTSGKGKGPYQLKMQKDGNLVVYDSNIAPVWASNTVTDAFHKSTPPYNAVMQDDCNFVVYDASKTPLWASNTAGK